MPSAAIGPIAHGKPLAHGALLAAAAALAVPPHQVVVVKGGADDEGGAALVRAAHRLPADVVVVVTEAQARAWADAGFGLLADKERLGGLATAYDCRDFTCRLPVTEPELLGVPGA